MAEKLWGGRFGAGAGSAVERFTASLAFDRRLWPFDLLGSEAHARMLGRQGIIPPDDAARILDGLARIRAEIEAGTFPWRVEDEDVHLNIERRLSELIGPAGGRLHTARSRNDQVALDTHLFCRAAAAELDAAVAALQEAVVGRAAAHPNAVMPGYTHLQRAQPVLLAHHMLAYFWMLERDRERLAGADRAADRMPLGAGALAGTSFPIDPAGVAAEIGFTRLYDNSMDAVSDRDYVCDLVYACAMAMVHASRLAADIVLFCTAEFGFVELPDAYLGGSSIMPQKRNPDAAELVRGKAARVAADLTALLSLVKGLPLTYHSDLQEDKERLFDAVDATRNSLRALAGMVASLRVNEDRAARAAREGHLDATEVADYLARKGMPFREAHAVAGRLVAAAAARGVALDALPLAVYREHCELFAEDIHAHLGAEAAVRARRSPGGTAPERVAEQLAAARRRLGTPHS